MAEQYIIRTQRLKQCLAPIKAGSDTREMLEINTGDKMGAVIFNKYKEIIEKAREKTLPLLHDYSRTYL